MTKTILIVDDEVRYRELYMHILDSAGFKTQEASSAEQAYDIISNYAPDMVVTDVRMPGMSGLELAETARRDHAELKIIVISGYFLPQRIGQRFLAKPFHMQELASAVRAEMG